MIIKGTILSLAALLVLIAGNAQAPAPQGKLISRIVEATAYSSTTAECDADPWTNASGLRCQDGDIACNFLPFGTRVWIEGFGSKTFVVRDRMARRLSHRIDIWYADTKAARKFGLKELKMTYWTKGGE